MVEALERQSARRKRRLESAKTTPEKKCRIELKKKGVRDGFDHMKWSKAHGCDTYHNGSNVEEKVSNSGDGVNCKKEKGSASGKGKPRGEGKCAACGSSTHLRSSRRDFPFNKSRANKEPHSDNSVDELIADSESDEVMSDSVSLESGEGINSSESEVIFSCTCGAEGRAHKRDCPLSSRNHSSGRTLFFCP